MKKFIYFLIFASSTAAYAYEAYSVKTFLCRNGKTMGLVLAQRIGFAADNDPLYFVKYSCDVKTLSNYRKGIEQPPEKMEPPLKACKAEDSEWLNKCYDEEFKPKCLEGSRVRIKECFETMAKDSNTTAPTNR